VTAYVRAIVICDSCGAQIVGGADDSVASLRGALTGSWAVDIATPSGIGRDLCSVCVVELAKQVGNGQPG
jgi:hypothetical protein